MAEVAAPEAPVTPPPVIERTETPRTPEEMRSPHLSRELSVTAFSNIRRNIDQATQDATDGKTLSRREQVFYTMGRIEGLKADALKDTPLSLDDDTHPIKITNSAGEIVTITQVTSVEEDILTCQSRVGEGEDAVYDDALTVSKADLAKAILCSEADSFAGDDAENNVLRTYIESIRPENPTSPDYSERLDNDLAELAKKQGLPTAEGMTQALERSYQDEEMPKDVADFLADIDASGKMLLEKQDFVDGMNHLGLGRDALQGKMDDLLAERTKAKAKLAHYQEQGVTDKAILKTLEENISDIDEQMTMVSSVDAIWKTAEAEGVSPIGEYYDKVTSGEVASEVASGVMQAIQTGDVDRIMDSMSSIIADLPDAKGLSPEMRAKILELTKKGAITSAKGLGLLALVAVAIAAAGVVVAGGAVMAVSQGVGKGH